MHVSVLIPSRARPALLCQTITGLAQQAADAASIEVLVRCDTDDPQWPEYAAGLDKLQRDGSMPVIRYFVGARHDGWRSNHVFFNELAAAARGQWLFMFNDDACLRTEHWDAQIPQNPAKPCVYAPACWDSRKRRILTWRAGDGRQMSNCFPIMHRDIYRCMGAFARHRHADCYIEWLMAPLGLQRPIGITITHLPTCSVAQGGSKWYREFHQSPTQEALRADEAALRRLLEQCAQ